MLKLGKREIGSKGHVDSLMYLSMELTRNNFKVSYNSFVKETVIGKVNFTNIIADYGQSSEKPKLIIAAHYDSKIVKEFDFYGATDSACSCSMILDLANFFNVKFQSGEWKSTKYDIRIVFFDGEEAFKSWGPTDSLYGSRHLANLWEKENKLKNIGLFILFDLLGAHRPNFFSYNFHRSTKTQQFYDLLFQIERQVNTSRYFNDVQLPWDLDDDHVPFGERNVSVLHIISNPFPNEWHTEKDDMRAIKTVPTNTLMRIFQIFFEKILKMSNF